MQAREEVKKLADYASMQRRMATGDNSMMGGLAASPYNYDYDDSRGIVGRAADRVRAHFHGTSRLLWVWAVAIHIFDMIYLQRFRESTLIVSISLYLSISIWAFFAFKEKAILKTENFKRLALFLIISSVYVLVPFLLSFVPEIPLLGGPTLFQWVSFFIAFLPVWPIYISHLLEDSTISKWTGWYINLLIFGLLFVMIFFLAVKVGSGTLISRIGVSSEELRAGPVVDFLLDSTLETGKSIKKGFVRIFKFDGVVPHLANLTGINYYTGVVDDNKEPVGLFIDNVRAQDRYSYAGSPVVVWADVRGKSFTEEIRVIPYCFIEGAGKKRIEGTPHPSSIVLFGLETTSLRCSFEGLEKGSYNAKVGASFNFETWAYVTYTFVDQELARNFDVEGKSVNSELDIPRMPRAVFTNGPALLGMGSKVDQPVRVDLLRNDKKPILGLTLDNAWTNGEIEQVHEFVMQVPDDFELQDCDRWLPEKKRPPFESKDGYNNFRFTREELSDPRVSFGSLTCQISIKEPVKFMAGQQKVQRTFAAQVKYDYKMQKSLPITVRE